MTSVEDDSIMILLENSSHSASVEVPKSLQNGKEASHSESHHHHHHRHKHASGDNNAEPQESRDRTPSVQDKIHNAVSEQMFISMVLLRHQPKRGTSRVVQALSKAGIRFRYFSAEDQSKSTVFAQQIGLDTTWNCIISLRDPRPEDSIYMEGASKLPRGIGSIREHIKTVDNVPLLVPIFSDSTPETRREMIKILQENGEVVLCIGSALNMDSTPSYAQADVAAAMQPLPSQCLDANTSESCRPPLLTSRRFATRRTTGCISADITCLPCSFVLHCNTPFDALLILLREGRHLLRNITQSANLFLSLSLLCFGVHLLCTLLLLPEPLNGYQLLWLTLIEWPLLSFSLLPLHIPQKTMSQLVSNNVINRTVVWRSARHALFLVTPAVLISCAVFLLAFQNIWDRSDWTCLFGFHPESNEDFHSTDFWHTMKYSSNLVMLTLVWCGIAISASYTHPSKSIWRVAPIRSLPWLIPAICSLVAQLCFFVVSLASLDQFDLISRVHWYVWVIMALSGPALCVTDLAVKRGQRAWYKRYQLEMRLLFDTKLGMHSPKETPEMKTPPPMKDNAQYSDSDKEEETV